MGNLEFAILAKRFLTTISTENILIKSRNEPYRGKYVSDFFSYFLLSNLGN